MTREFTGEKPVPRWLFSLTDMTVRPAASLIEKLISSSEWIVTEALPLALALKVTQVTFAKLTCYNF